ncbi:MAG: CdaR family protein [Eubacteriales bacterium]|nr:CdaR family protein [Eubacteriales bacterium]
MKEKIFKNFGLKIASAAFAVILWTIIVNIYDPNTTYTFSNITVQLINTESLTDKNYTYEVAEGEKISVTVSGPKSIVTDLKTSDIVAVADLSKVTAFADYVDIQVHVERDGQILSNVDATPRTSALKLNIENRDTKTFGIDVNTIGNTASGYAVTGTNSSPTYIKVTGPTSVLGNVAYVKAEVDVSGARENVVTQAELKLYDSDNNEINDDSLGMTSYTADVTVFVGRTKTVTISVEPSGSVADGYVLDKMELSQTSAIITGSEDTLNKINNIVIQGSTVNVAGLTSDRTYYVNLSNYVPEEIRILSDKQINVVAKVNASSGKNIKINTSSVQISDIPSGYTASVISKDINVSLVGSENSLKNISAGDIKMTVKLTGLTEGTKTVNIEFTVPDNCKVTGTYTADVVIVKNIGGTASTETTETTKEQETTKAN